MSLYLPPELSWLGWIAGGTWPEGDEDKIWAVSDAYKDAATALRTVIPDIEDAKRTAVAAYPEGAGGEKIAAMFDQMLVGDQSMESLAKFMDQISDAAFDFGTQIEAAKLTTIISLIALAIEIAWAWMFPPTAPVEEAAAQVATQTALRRMRTQLQNRILAKALSVFGEKFAGLSKNWILKILEAMLISGGMDAAVQLGQMAAGHRKHFGWEQFGAAVVSGGAGAPFGRIAANGMNKYTIKFAGDKIGNPWVRGLNGAVVGIGSGTVEYGFGSIGAAVVTGDWAGTLGNPAGWVGGAARGGITGGFKGFVGINRLDNRSFEIDWKSPGGTNHVPGRDGSSFDHGRFENNGVRDGFGGDGTSSQPPPGGNGSRYDEPPATFPAGSTDNRAGGPLDPSPDGGQRRDSNGNSWTNGQGYPANTHNGSQPGGFGDSGRNGSTSSGNGSQGGRTGDGQSSGSSTNRSFGSGDGRGAFPASSTPLLHNGNSSVSNGSSPSGSLSGDSRNSSVSGPPSERSVGSSGNSGGGQFGARPVLGGDGSSQWQRLPSEDGTRSSSGASSQTGSVSGQPPRPPASVSDVSSVGSGQPPRSSAVSDVSSVGSGQSPRSSAVSDVSSVGSGQPPRPPASVSDVSSVGSGQPPRSSAVSDVSSTGSGQPPRSAAGSEASSSGTGQPPRSSVAAEAGSTNTPPRSPVAAESGSGGSSQSPRTSAGSETSSGSDQPPRRTVGVNPEGQQHRPPASEPNSNIPKQPRPALPHPGPGDQSPPVRRGPEPNVSAGVSPRSHDADSSASGPAQRPSERPTPAPEGDRPAPRPSVRPDQLSDPGGPRGHDTDVPDGRGDRVFEGDGEHPNWVREGDEVRITSPDGTEHRVDAQGNIVIGRPDDPTLVKLGPDNSVEFLPNNGNHAVAEPGPRADAPKGPSRSEFGFGRSDGTQHTVLPDGSVRTTSPDGSTTIVKRDASAEFRSPWDDRTHFDPDGTSVQTRPDGPTVVTKPDDSVHIVPNDQAGRERDGDGNVVVTSPDGTRHVIGEDGSILVGRPDDPQLMKIGAEYGIVFVGPDGTGPADRTGGKAGERGGIQSPTFTRPDRVSHTVFEDGSVRTKSPDGWTTTVKPDGTTEFLSPTGEKTVYKVDGTVVESGPGRPTVITGPDGTKQTVEPNGAVTVELPDNTKHVVFDGTDVQGGGRTEHPDGTVLHYDHNDTLNIGLRDRLGGFDQDGPRKQGTIQMDRPDGTGFESSPKGTKVFDSDGTVYERGPRGSVRVTAPNGQTESRQLNEPIELSNGAQLERTPQGLRVVHEDGSVSEIGPRGVSFTDGDGTVRGIRRDGTAFVDGTEVREIRGDGAVRITENQTAWGSRPDGTTWTVDDKNKVHVADPDGAVAPPADPQSGYVQGQDLTAKPRPPRTTENDPMPDPYNAPTAPDTEDWIPQEYKDELKYKGMQVPPDDLPWDPAQQFYWGSPDQDYWGPSDEYYWGPQDRNESGPPNTEVQGPSGADGALNPGPGEHVRSSGPGRNDDRRQSGDGGGSGGSGDGGGSSADGPRDSGDGEVSGDDGAAGADRDSSRSDQTPPEEQRPPQLDPEMLSRMLQNLHGADGMLPPGGEGSLGPSEQTGSGEETTGQDGPSPDFWRLGSGTGMQSPFGGSQGDSGSPSAGGANGPVRPDPSALRAALDRLNGAVTGGTGAGTGGAGTDGTGQQRGANQSGYSNRPGTGNNSGQQHDSTGADRTGASERSGTTDGGKTSDRTGAQHGSDRQQPGDSRNTGGESNSNAPGKHYGAGDNADASGADNRTTKDGADSSGRTGNGDQSNTPGSGERSGAHGTDAGGARNSDQTSGPEHSKIPEQHGESASDRDGTPGTTPLRPPASPLQDGHAQSGSSSPTGTPASPGMASPGMTPPGATSPGSASSGNAAGSPPKQSRRPRKKDKQRKAPKPFLLPSPFEAPEQRAGPDETADVPFTLGASAAVTEPVIDTRTTTKTTRSTTDG
ncbi:hypothetical protein [Nocardia brasiliensis]|uniref:WXG100-like domain-containing protein n=1 Tax=Nocardia brasiliensis TaxID=37326 RepID=UPI002456C348|nr:hypothetical protein [Nocardia brasiliensis]